MPLQPPDAVHPVAFVELQLKTAALPAVATGGLAVSTAVGTTLTVALTRLLAPPAPVQVIEYVVLTEMANIVWPLAAFAPLQPPDASQEVAFDELQLSVAELPAVTISGLTLRVAVGTTFTLTLAGALVPPGPLHVKTYVALAVNAPVACVPLGGSAPLQLPEAEQDVAFVEVQVNVELEALATTVDEVSSAAAGTGSVVAPPPPHDASSSAPAPSHRE